MNKIEGIDLIKLAVTDLEDSNKFLQDMGLTFNGSSWTTLTGAAIELVSADENKILEVVWGVKGQESIDLVDPNGVQLKFRPSIKTPVTLTAAETNGWNSINRVNREVPVYEKIDAIEICHVVMTTDCLEESERFYSDLGFVVSDRLIDRGTFMRANKFGGHHDLFLIQSDTKELHHIAITVRDIYQVFAGGLQMEKAGWTTEIGPGRHPISSSFFWYFKSPLGGMLEYTANEDFLTEEWEPRSFEFTPGITTEWAIEGGIDPATKRQRK